MTLVEGVRRLLEQCDKEDACSPLDRHYLHTSEIRYLLGSASASDYAELERLIEKEKL